MDVAQKTIERERFEMIGGAVCLDFVNTVGGMRGRVADETLHSYVDVVRWSEQADLLTASASTRSIERATLRPDEAADFFTRAVAFREALYRLFVAVLDGEDPAPDDLAALNAELAIALRHTSIVCDGEGFVLRTADDDQAPDSMLWHIARSAADLLLSPTLNSLRQCAGETCGWLFLDATKNHSRRWCAMGDCGNRAKVQRYRTRQRAGSS